MKFQQLTEATLVKFESRDKEWDNLQFFGCTLQTVKPGAFKVIQQDYIAKLGPVPADATFEHYRSFRAEIAWQTHMRPDVSCCANRAAQVVSEPSDNVREAHVKLLNSAIKKMRSTPELGLRYEKLDEATLHPLVYTDASFGTNDDLTSQLGYLVLLHCGGKVPGTTIRFASKNITFNAIQ